MKQEVKSFQTDFYEEQAQTQPKYTTQCPRQLAYTKKLQKFISEYTQTMEKNMPILRELQAQKNIYDKIYQKQKQKLQTNNVTIMREEFERELTDIRAEKERMQELISELQHKFQDAQETYKSNKCKLETNQVFYLKTLQQIKAENEQFHQCVLQKQRERQAYIQVIRNNQLILKDKEQCQQQYRDAVVQVEKLQRIKKIRYA